MATLGLSALAIIRKDTGPFTAGQVVRVSPLMARARKNRGLEFPVAGNGDGKVVTIPRESLLPYDRFLGRGRLIREFWFVMKKPKPGSAASKEFSKPFLTDPWRIKWGRHPYRFESRGELVYYLNRFGLSSRSIVLCQAKHEPKVSTVHTRKKL